MVLSFWVMIARRRDVSWSRERTLEAVVDGGMFSGDVVVGGLVVSCCRGFLCCGLG